MTCSDVCNTSVAGPSVTSGASTARNTMISITKMTRLDRISVSLCALAWEFWLSTAVGNCPVR